MLCCALTLLCLLSSACKEASVLFSCIQTLSHPYVFARIVAYWGKVLWQEGRVAGEGSDTVVVVVVAFVANAVIVIAVVVVVVVVLVEVGVASIICSFSLLVTS